MANEDFVSAQLVMDRSMPLGNSEDTFNRRALHTKIGNKQTEPVPVEFNVPSIPLISNILCAAASTEYSHTFQADTKKYTIRARGSSKIQLSFVSGTTNTNFITIPSGVSASEDQVKVASLVIYFQTDKNNETIEVLEWK